MIERSLLAAGVITQRISTRSPAFAENPEFLEAVLRLQVEAGLLVLQVTANDGESLLAQVRDRQLVLDETNRGAVLPAVLHLLHETEIIFDTRKAGHE
jgi:hypothetical protein